MTTTKQNQELQDRVEKAVQGKGALTMYQLANIASDLIGDRVREQQMYNYRKNGLIKGLVDGKAPEAVAIEFLVKFVGKRTS